MNTMTEAQFRQGWIALLWMAMAKTGRGYRRPSLRHTGKRGADGKVDCRKDKDTTTKLQRRLALKVQVA